MQTNYRAPPPPPDQEFKACMVNLNIKKFFSQYLGVDTPPPPQTHTLEYKNADHLSI